MKLIEENITKTLDEIYLVETLNLNNKTILELGCGDAKMTKQIAQNGFDRKIIACEVDEIQHKKNLKLNIENIEFKLCGAQNIPLEDNSIDMVLMFKSLHHIPKSLMEKSLHEIKRVLKPNGLAYISEPLFFGKQNELVSMFHNEEQVRIDAFEAIKNAIENEDFKLFNEIFLISCIVISYFVTSIKINCSMKTKLLSICLFFASFLVYSQEILLSFKAEDENTNSINLETIEVENITTGNTITVGTELPFNLSDAVLSADSFSLEETQQGIQNVFPNPTNSETNITFYNASKQENTVQVYDVVGKEVVKLTRIFGDGLQTVKFVPNTTGVFFIKLIQQNKSYQSKIVVTKSISSDAKIEAVEFGKKKSLHKKTAEPFFNIGDELKFTTLYINLLCSKSSITSLLT